MEIKKNQNQKGTALVDGAATDEVLASTHSVLTKTLFGGQKGLQQFYSPPVLSKLAKAVIGERIAVLDPTAGDGSLLSAWDKPQAYGVEIDHDQVENSNGSYNAIKGDIQHVFTLMKLSMERWEGIVANPPFDLQWSDPEWRSGKPVNSALLTFIYVQKLLADTGQFMFVDGANHFEKILQLEEARGVYAVIECNDLFPGTDHDTVIAFGINPVMKSETFSGVARREVPAEMLDLVGDWVREQRTAALGTYGHVSTSSYARYDLPDQFRTIQTEYDRRLEGRVKKNREYDALLVGSSTVQWLPSAFATLALRQADEMYAFQGLNKVSISYFAQNERLWTKLLGFRDSGVVTIEPKLEAAVENIVGDIRKEIVPLYEVKPQQRLAFLDDIDSIKCIVSDPEKGYIEGESYRIDTSTKDVVKTFKKVVESKKTPGEWVEKTLTTQAKAMSIRIGRTTFVDSGDESSEQIQYIIDHFELPDPGEISTRHPQEIARLEQAVRSVIEDVFIPSSAAWEKKHPELTPFSVRRFQIEDIARLLFKRRGLLSWEQGLGKMLGGLLFTLTAFEMGAQKAALFVVPGDLVPQWQREIERFTGKKATVIKSHGQCHEIAKRLKRGGEGIFIAHYEMLTQVGLRGTKGNKPLPPIPVYEKTEMKQVKGTGKYGYFYCEVETDEEGNPLTDPETNRWKYKLDDNGRRIPHGIKSPYSDDVPKWPDGRKYHTEYGYIPEKYVEVTKTITSKEVCPKCRADQRNGWNGMVCEAEDDKGVKCGYAHFSQKVKPMASKLSVAFKHGVIVMDEITMIQGDYSQRSLAMRGLRADYRLGLTGTPIKNYIRQAFWILWWCVGNGSKRLGYTYENPLKFESDFSVIQWEMTGGRKLNRKALPEVTNLSRFWRILASTTIRRRKEETGEVIVPRFDYEIKVPLGVAQRAQQDKWLKDFPKLFEEKYPDAPVVKAGMHEIMAPMLGLQQKLDYACTIPLSDPDNEWTGIEVSNWTPANLKVMELAMALAKQGRKVLVGSNLKSAPGFFAECLNEKGVKALHILDDDGNTVTKEKRAKVVHAFQTDDAQVFCAGMKAIRLGHNLDAADACIIHGIEWDRETFDQFVNRIHRLTSKKPIDVFVVLPTADEKTPTFTEKKWGIVGQKGAAIELALDGRLIEKHKTAVDEAQVIRELMALGVKASGDEVDEDEIAEAWAALAAFEEYEAPEGLIPEQPFEITTEGREAATSVGLFLQKVGGAMLADKLQAKIEEIVASATNFSDLPLGDDEDGQEEFAGTLMDGLDDEFGIGLGEIDGGGNEAEELDAWIEEEDDLPIEDEGAETPYYNPAATGVGDDVALPAAPPVVPDDAVLAQNAAELEEQAEDAEEAEAVAAELATVPTTDDATAAMLAQLAEQMAAMQAELTAVKQANAVQAAEIERLKSDEQLALFGEIEGSEAA